MSTAFVYCATCGAANPPEAPACFACGNAPLVADAEAPGCPPSTPSASPGLLKGRYRLRAQLGTGGFGAVYQAEDTELGNRIVAVKEMSQRGLTPEEAQEATQAFRNEALLLANLAHPNLPRIYEQFSQNGHWYLVMDFIEGETLEARLSHTPGGRLPVPEVVQIGLQLCTVLEYLHTRQPPIIFRDLKPANIMVTPAGDLSLIDFGIARHFKPGQTKDTIAFGSAGYAAPEQYGKAQTTTQSDIYSLGATLHQLLSGHDPSDSPFLFAPLDLVEPDGLETLILQMLETQPSKRPENLAAIKQDLQRMADDLTKGHTQHSPGVARAPASPKSAAPPKLSMVVSAPASSTNARPPLLLYQGHTERVNTISWSPDGRTIASGGNDRTIRLWESVTGNELSTFPGLSTFQGMDRVHMLAWSPDGEYLAWVRQGNVLRLWNAHTGEFRSIKVAHMSILNNFVTGLLTLAWSPEGTQVAVGGLEKTVEIWEVKAEKRLLTYTGHRRFFENSAVYALAWSPNGQWIASASVDAAVQVWEARTGHRRYTYRGSPVGSRGGVTWAPDSMRLASASEKAAIHIWDAGTGMDRMVLSGHSGLVNRVAWSPDGRYLASGGSDQTVRVWDSTSGKEVMVYYGHAGEVNTLAWSPDSTRLASAGDDHVVRIWPVLP